MRPIRHRRKNRVRAHVFLCMLGLLRPVAHDGGLGGRCYSLTRDQQAKARRGPGSFASSEPTVLSKKFPKLFATDSQSAVSNFAPHYLPQTLSPSINSTLLPHDFSSSQNKLFRVSSTEKARASEEHSAGSIDASVFDAASSVIPADGDVVSSWKISSRPAETVSVFETLYY